MSVIVSEPLNDPFEVLGRLIDIEQELPDVTVPAQLPVSVKGVLGVTPEIVRSALP